MCEPLSRAILFSMRTEFMMLTSWNPCSNQENQPGKTHKTGTLDLKGVLHFTDEDIHTYTAKSFCPTQHI